MPKMEQWFSRVRDGVERSWRVDRLWKLSSELKARRVRISRLPRRNFKGECWFRRKPSFEHVLDHMRDVMAADLRYPIILDPWGNIMDGYHRVAKAVITGKKSILAVRFETLPKPDQRRRA